MSSSSTLLAAHGNCLPVGTKVAEFEIIGLVGEGGFGIVYLARDTTLDRVVALKEFMPSALAGRVDGLQVAARSPIHQSTYEAGLSSFINEARLLAKFSHTALVEVYRFWEGNGTAYMAMRFYSGETLRQRVAGAGATFTEESIAQIMAPIFDALEVLHREQVFHRDIAPDNIILSEGRPVLLDFGSARRIIGDGTQALTTILKPGYAPIEQYVNDGTMKQGAWTDVYALGGVLYYLATGKVPQQSVSRLVSDPLLTVNALTGHAFSDGFSNAVAKAMAVRVESRPQNIKELRDMLGWNTAPQTRVIASFAAQTTSIQPKINDSTFPPATQPLGHQGTTMAAAVSRKGGVRKALIAAGAACLLFALALGYLHYQPDMQRPAAKADPAALDSGPVANQAQKPATPVQPPMAVPLQQTKEIEPPAHPASPTPVTDGTGTPTAPEGTQKVAPAVDQVAGDRTRQTQSTSARVNIKGREPPPRDQGNSRTILKNDIPIMKKPSPPAHVNTVHRARCANILQKATVNSEMTPEDKLFLSTSCL